MNSTVNTKKCHACQSDIDFIASVCKFCQRDQSHFMWNVNRTAGMVAIFGLVLTLFSALSANFDAKNAESALEQSEAALSEVIRLTAVVEKSNEIAISAQLESEMARDAVRQALFRVEQTEQYSLDYLLSSFYERFNSHRLCQSDFSFEANSKNDGLSLEAAEILHNARCEIGYDSTVEYLSRALDLINRMLAASPDDSELSERRNNLCEIAEIYDFNKYATNTSITRDDQLLDEIICTEN